MTSLEFKQELKRIHDHAEQADKMAADLIVAAICNITILVIAYITIEALL